MELKKIFKYLIILSFAIVILTSIPLFINYLKGTKPPFQIFVDLHVWFGWICIFFILYRMAEKKFMKVF